MEQDFHIVAPKRYYRIAIGVFFFLQGFTFASWAARIPDFKAFFALSEGQLGTLLWAFPLGQLLCVPLAGYLVERFTSRRMLLCAACLYPFTLALLGFIPFILSSTGNSHDGVWIFAAVLFFLGIVANLHNLSVNTQAVGVEKMYGRSIMATFHGLWSLAGFVAGMVGSLMAAHHIVPFYHYLGIFAFGLLVVIFLHRYTLRQDEARTEQQEKPTFNIFKGMDAFVYLMGFIALGSMLCEGVMYDWSAVYYKEYLFFDDTRIRFGYTACMLAMASCRFLADFIVNRFGAVTVVRLSGILTALGFLLMVLCHSLVWVTVGAALVGAGVSSVVPVCYGAIGRHPGVVPGRAINAVSTIGFTGFAVSPPLIGYLAEWIGLRWVFVCVAVLAVLIASLAGRLKEE
ncbi:MFS transporter [bacterium]|nr:MFS transporter [bacterium]